MQYRRLHEIKVHSILSQLACGLFYDLLPSLFSTLYALAKTERWTLPFPLTRTS